MAEVLAWHALRDFVGQETYTADDAFISSCYDEADEMLVKYIIDSGVAEEDIPTTIGPFALARATVEVGADLYYRKAAKYGYSSLAGAVNAVRVNRDPLTAAYPLIDPYLPAGFS
jgi:hypothetical protein